MRRRKHKSTRSGEEGVVVLLVAMFLLFVIGAMAALAIDLVTIYTARSEAQQVADAAALAGARALANSGMTSDPTNMPLRTAAENLANKIAVQVALQNKVGGGPPNVTPPTVDDSNPQNPHITVVVTKTDLPTYFSRIWGNTAGAVKATATAEAYNPSGLNTGVGTAPPVAPACVKPWLLPNLDPSNPGNPIFDVNTGAIANAGILGFNSSKSPGSAGNLMSACPLGNCGSGSGLPAATAWKFYPGDQSTFPAPTQALPTCAAIPTPTAYQESIAGCVTTQISCNSIVNIDVADHPGRAKHTADAVNCLTHAVATLSDGDVADPFPVPSTAPFTFLGGNQNPIASARGQQVLVSNSLVTAPVIDSSPGKITPTTTTAKVIGFVQLFLNADGGPTTNVDPAPIQTKIVNMVGCGTNATGQPVLGNGSSPVAVRLVSTAP